MMMYRLFLSILVCLFAYPALAQTPPPDPVRAALGNVVRQYQAFTTTSDNFVQALEAYQKTVDEKIKVSDERIKELEKQIKELSPSPNGR